jgi:hypothetical protein
MSHLIPSLITTTTELHPTIKPHTGPIFDKTKHIRKKRESPTNNGWRSFADVHEGVATS